MRDHCLRRKCLLRWHLVYLVFKERLTCATPAILQAANNTCRHLSNTHHINSPLGSLMVPYKTAQLLGRYRRIVAVTETLRWDHAAQRHLRGIMFYQVSLNTKQQLLCTHRWRLTAMQVTQSEIKAMYCTRQLRANPTTPFLLHMRIHKLIPRNILVPMGTPTDHIRQEPHWLPENLVSRHLAPQEM